MTHSLQLGIFWMLAAILCAQLGWKDVAVTFFWLGMLGAAFHTVVMVLNLITK